MEIISNLCEMTEGPLETQAQIHDYFYDTTADVASGTVVQPSTGFLGNFIAQSQGVARTN
jgi:hypothetical protein